MATTTRVPKRKIIIPKTKTLRTRAAIKQAVDATKSVLKGGQIQAIKGGRIRVVKGDQIQVVKGGRIQLLNKGGEIQIKVFPATLPKKVKSGKRATNSGTKALKQTRTTKTKKK